MGGGLGLSRHPFRKADMPDNYFDDEPGEDNTPSTRKEIDQAKREESGDDQTFVLPKAIAGGKSFKPGDEMVVEIVAEHEDSFEVKYAPEVKSEETEPETPTEDESDMPMKEGIDSMMD